MKYNRADFSSTARTARHLSEKDGRLRFVYATALGYAITLRRVTFQDSWWTNGHDCGQWKAYATKGITQHKTAQELAHKPDASI
jgi:hypothetical protein